MAAARVIGLMTTIGSAYAVVNGLLSPQTVGTRPGGWAAILGAVVVVACGGLVLLLRAHRAPAIAPVVLGLVCGATMLLLCLWTRDASFGAQICLGWPALFAAFHLRPRGAWLLTLQAVVGDAVLLGVEEGLAGVLRDTPAHLATFGLVTALLTTAGERQERLTARLRAEAEQDALTGLLARGAFDRALAGHLADGTAAGLLLVDVDRFKEVNDTHGHPVGDAVLRAVAAELRAACREQDVVARVGGDEFAVVLVADPGADGGTDRDLRGVADRFHAAVRRSHVPAEPARPLSVSVGLARAGAHEPARGLVERADAALYEAKRGGRDRVAEAVR
ncbi:GGDEF domain-containing protein [Kineococcus rhizosphaerae]|uniref:Diguanylate cyclase (GGDEF)-like protein n=1 Tax=Kineococcus rhizosphaerae TaxID=559628 RepID=A0A2T0R875_9ACTN|nr:GGDEF domain-containing protein [Kineococcus rhizosphaerae]PRY17373.1 diguanylate cyclase (GGDEF)-like protein [Kineococcus rhizosphaerae]